MFSEGLASDICVLWEHPTTKRCVERKNDIQVLDSGPYFLEKARQISLPDYVPSDEDVLRARSQTTGIITFKFEVRGRRREGSPGGWKEVKASLKKRLYINPNRRSYSVIFINHESSPGIK